MPKSPRNPSPKSPHSKATAKPGKPKTPKLQGKAAKLANLKKAPSHQPKRKRPAPIRPLKTAPPHSSKPHTPLDNWTNLPLAHRHRHERMTHIDAWLQRVWREDDGSMKLKNANDFAAELRVGIDTIYADIAEMKTTWRMPIGIKARIEPRRARRTRW